jgi:DNA topoisomerase-3
MVDLNTPPDHADKEPQKIELKWSRRKIFDHHVVLMFLEQLKEESFAEVTDLTQQFKTKRKPPPLNTVDLQKLASKKLHFSPSHTMEVAEKLYNKGFLSYPRTETNSFAASFDFNGILTELALSKKWGCFAKKLLEGFDRPRGGKSDDKAHPPIYPVRNAPLNKLDRAELKLYELVCRSFIACCSDDA